MKRILILLLVFAAGVYSGAAYMLGGQAREEYFSLLKENGASGLVSLSSQSYEQGFFRSTARTLVEIRVPEASVPGASAQDQTADDRVFRFSLRHELRHGPLPDLLSDYSLAPALAVMDSVAEGAEPGQEVALFTEIPELAQSSSRMRIGFDGEVEGDLTVPAFEKSGAGERLSFGGLTVHVVHEPRSAVLRGDFSLPAMSMDAATGRFGVEGFSGTFDLKEALPLLYVGRVRSAVSAMNMTEPGAETLVVSDLRVASDSTCDGVTANFLQKFDIASVSYGKNAFGPLSCDVEARNLDAPALSEFQTRLRLLAEAHGGDVDAISAQVGDLYLTLFAKLLAGQPELRISRLRLGTPMGDMTGSLLVRSEAPAGQAVANPLLLLPFMVAEAEVSTSEELLVGLVGLDLRSQEPAATDEEIERRARERVGEETSSLMARGLLVREGPNIVARAALRNGRLTVNGQEMPLF